MTGLVWLSPAPDSLHVRPPDLRPSLPWWGAGGTTGPARQPVFVV